MKVFEFLVIYHPSEEEKKKGEVDRILVPHEMVLAPDVAGATLVAGRKIPEDYLNKLDRLEVAVRPF